MDVSIAPLDSQLGEVLLWVAGFLGKVLNVLTSTSAQPDGYHSPLRWIAGLVPWLAGEPASWLVEQTVRSDSQSGRQARSQNDSIRQLVR